MDWSLYVNVIAGEDSDDSFGSGGLGSVDLQQPGVRDRAAQNLRIGHAGELDIAGENGLARDLFNSIDSVSILAHRSVSRSLFHCLKKTKAPLRSEPRQ